VSERLHQMHLNDLNRFSLSKSWKLCRQCSADTRIPIITKFKGLYDVPSNSNLEHLLHSCDEKKGALWTRTAHDPSPLFRYLRTRFTYSSNALEGNQVTLDDLVQFVDNGISIGK
jgi:hypothetical protein